jgi:hypothetical protein
MQPSRSKHCQQRYAHGAALLMLKDAELLWQLCN